MTRGTDSDGRSHSSRSVRHRELRRIIREDPFLTDEELASSLDVSVQTIRLDRLALGIPEVRERTRELANKTLGRVRSMGMREIVGELVDLELGQQGLSILQTGQDMSFERTGLVMSQFVFAQADSLALAIIDSPRAVTVLANAKFKQPVTVGSRLIAKAEVLRRRDQDYVVLVQTRVGDKVVFRGKFVVSGIDDTRPEEER